MGTDIHVRIVKKDYNTDTWKQIKLYRKEKKKFKIVDIYPFREEDLFDILSEKTNDYRAYPYHAYPISLTHLPINLKQEIEKKQKILGYYDFKEINLADLKIYLMHNPKIRDWDYEDDDPKAWIDNPVKYFIERIEQYLDFADPYWDGCRPASDVRIIYRFDC